MRHSQARALRRPLALTLIVVLALSVSGFLLASSIAHHDQQTAATRRARTDRDRAVILLGRANRYVVGLAELLASEPTADQQRFAFLAGTTLTSFDLVDALWIERAGDLLLARYATTVAPGTDVSRWPALAAPMVRQGTVFAATATRLGSLHGTPGFWLLQSGRFGRAAGSSGYLAVFVSAGWMTLSLADDPRRAEAFLDGQRLSGAATGSATGSASFLALGHGWLIRAAAPPSTDLETALPWLGLAWPWAAGLLAMLIGSAVLRRRRAEREVERIFDLSLDMLGSVSHDGFLVHVNPAFTRILGYAPTQLTSRPFIDFVLEEDQARTREAFDRLLHGEEVVQFENRYRCRDGSVCWLQWSVRPAPAERLLYAAARDITARREAEERVRRGELDLRASRDQLRLLADEHAAVRRVATLVAHGVAPAELFGAVAREVRALLGADAALLLRCESSGTLRTAAADADGGIQIEVGERQPLVEDELAAGVRVSGSITAARHADVSMGPPGARLREQGLRAAAAVPVVVNGALWGVIEVAWRQARPVPIATAERLTHFAELVATSLVNAHSRAELTASRARVVAAADETRRRIERDLHDGTQQRLVALALALRVVESQVPTEFQDLRERISAVAEGLALAVSDLQEFSRGIHPTIVTRGGLGPALRALARRSSIPVQLDTDITGRMDTAVEVAAYYLVSEALTNAAKHAQASRIALQARTRGSCLEVTISDDGIGGADATRGSGLLGLLDRVHAIGGSLEVQSEPGHGTTLHATFSLERRDHGDGAPDGAEGDAASAGERLAR